MAGYGSGLYGRGNYGIDPKEASITVNAASSTAVSAQRILLAAVSDTASSSTTVTAQKINLAAITTNATSSASVTATRAQNA